MIARPALAARARRHWLRLVIAWRLALTIRAALAADRAVLVAIVECEHADGRTGLMDVAAYTVGAGQIETVTAAFQLMREASKLAGPYPAGDVEEAIAQWQTRFGVRAAAVGTEKSRAAPGDRLC